MTSQKIETTAEEIGAAILFKPYGGMENVPHIIDTAICFVAEDDTSSLCTDLRQFPKVCDPAYIKFCVGNRLPNLGHWVPVENRWQLYSKQDASELYSRKVFEEVCIECEKYGYRTMTKFNKIFIFSKFEEWYFEPDYGHKGKIILMHHDFKPKIARLKCHNDYHTQFARTMSIPNLFVYIHQHECAKYGGQNIAFAFTRDGTQTNAANTTFVY